MNITITGPCVVAHGFDTEAGQSVVRTFQDWEEAVRFARPRFLACKSLPSGMSDTFHTNQTLSSVMAANEAWLGDWSVSGSD